MLSSLDNEANTVESRFLGSSPSSRIGNAQDKPRRRRMLHDAGEHPLAIDLVYPIREQAQALSAPLPAACKSEASDNVA